MNAIEQKEKPRAALPNKAQKPENLAAALRGEPDGPFRLPRPRPACEEALRALDPSLWTGDETPHWRACARAFPDMADWDEQGKNPELVDAWCEPTSKAADAEEVNAMWLDQTPGFWLSFQSYEPCDQTLAIFHEQSFFFPTAFPWEVALRSRASGVLKKSDNGRPVRPWLDAGIARAKEKGGCEAVVSRCEKALAAGELPITSSRCSDNVPDANPAWHEKPIWGVWEICVDAQDATGSESPSNQDLQTLSEFMAAFSEGFMDAMLKDPAWTAGSPQDFFMDERYRPRWGKNDCPACLVKTGERLAEFEARALARQNKQLDDAAGAEEKPAAKPRPRL